MAYFVISKKIKNEWKLLEPTKIDLRTDVGREQLSKLKKENELVLEIPENKAHIRQYAIVQGQIFWTYKLATLKTKILVFAVENRLAAIRLKELLKPRAHGDRKKFLEKPQL